MNIYTFTGCDCNFDLCKSQRNGDYVKWKWFDYCLYNAIGGLSTREYGYFSVFTGLSGVKLDYKTVRNGFFVTYVSASWNEQIAISFTNGNGMIIEIDKDYKYHQDVYCCNVSWISKFPDECEILFARGIYPSSSFKCKILDHGGDIQRVLITKNDDSIPGKMGDSIFVGSSRFNDLCSKRLTVNNINYNNLWSKR